MNLKPEERKKAILLASATAVIFVFGGLNIYRQLQKPTSGSSSPTTVTPASETTSSSASGSLVNPGAQNLPAQVAYLPTDTSAERGGKMDLYADVLPEANNTRDPFMRIDAEPDPDASSVQRLRRTPPPINFHQISPAPQPMSPVLPGPKAPQNAEKETLRPVEIAKPQMEELTLAGVIAGSSSVAVIHIGDHSYQAGDGEKLPYNISLVRVTEAGVYLKQDGKVLFLAIGKSLRTAIPVKANTLPQNPAPSSDTGTSLSSESTPYRSEAAPEREGPTQITVNTPSDK